MLNPSLRIEGGRFARLLRSLHLQDQAAPISSEPETSTPQEPGPAGQQALDRMSLTSPCAGGVKVDHTMDWMSLTREDAHRA